MKTPPNLKLRFHSLAGFCILLALTACRTPPLPEGENRPLNAEEIRLLLANAKDPRTLNLNVYEGNSGPVFNNSFRLHAYQAAEVDMLGSTNQPAMVTLETASGQTFISLLDPSTPESWASVLSGAELKLIPLGPPYYAVQPAHLEDTCEGIIAHAYTVKIDSLYIESPLYCIRMHTEGLGPLTRGQENPVPDLVLGHRFLQSFRYVQLDYPARKIRFSASSRFESIPGKQLTEAPLFIIGGTLGTRGYIEGRETSLLLDPAGSYAMAVPEAQAAHRNVRIGELILPDLTEQSNRDVGLQDADYPRLGFEALRKYVVTLDYQKNTIYFARP